jgi:RNA polymerase sigma-70 factor (ECF subfamily)
METFTPTPAREPDPEEAQLLARAQRGNLFAFEEIVRRYQRRAYAVALRIVRRHDVADDVAQEAFVRAHRNLASFDTTRPFGPWIARISANLALNHLRSPQAREQELPDGHLEQASAAPDPLLAVLDNEARDVLARALGDLPADQRAVFVLRVQEDLSYKEIADALGIPQGTVMSRLFRARETLRERLAPYLGAALRRRGASGART